MSITRSRLRNRKAGNLNRQIERNHRTNYNQRDYDYYDDGYDRDGDYRVDDYGDDDSRYYRNTGRANRGPYWNDTYDEYDRDIYEEGFDDEFEGDDYDDYDSGRDYLIGRGPVRNHNSDDHREYSEDHRRRYTQGYNSGISRGTNQYGRYDNGREDMPSRWSRRGRRPVTLRYSNGQSEEAYGNYNPRTRRGGSSSRNTGSNARRMKSEF
jgi:hypothetical protein